jgi:type II secretory pathway predicted ATPase ExeA
MATGLAASTVVQHWGLVRDPFSHVDPIYVPTPGHSEAESRLVHSIEAGARLIVLEAPEGLGKSMILRRALSASRSPRRRVAKVSCPIDGTSLLTGLARNLGQPVSANASRADAWRSLVDGVRLCRLQALSVVLAIDDAHFLSHLPDRADVDRLTHLDPLSTTILTIVRVGRDDAAWGDPGGLAVRLTPLSRNETDRYLTAKLRLAGRRDPAFAPPAVTELHAIARGVPRLIDQLASACLAWGAFGRLESVSSRVVEYVQERFGTPSVLPPL